jgi:hypothetical protein
VADLLQRRARQKCEGEIGVGAGAAEECDGGDPQDAEQADRGDRERGVLRPCPQEREGRRDRAGAADRRADPHRAAERGRYPQASADAFRRGERHPRADDPPDQRDGAHVHQQACVEARAEQHDAEPDGRRAAA